MAPAAIGRVDTSRTVGKRFLMGWLAASGVFAGCVALLVAVEGPRGVLRIMGSGDGTAHVFRFLVFLLAWAWITGTLLLSQFPTFARRHAVFLVVLTLLGLRYLDEVREPHMAGLGDFPVYYQAAVKVRAGEPIQGRALAQQSLGAEIDPADLYIYPPLLATALSPLTFLSEDTVGYLFHLANYLAVILLVVLLYLVLPRYRYSPEMAAGSVLFLLAVNVPVSRTLAYHQVNLFVFDLILLSLFWFPRALFASTLALSLAIHLKVYPVLLVLPFLAAKQWRWLGWFIVSQAVVVVATSLVSSPRYYLDFMSQITVLGETGLRNSSITVFFANTFRILGLDLPTLQGLLSTVTRLVLLAALIVAGLRLTAPARRAIPPNADQLVLGGYALIPVAMLLLSPSVWEHHYVLLILTAAVLATFLRTAVQTWSFLLAYGFIFLLPVVELYPVSYLPLFAVALIVVVLYAVTLQPRSEGPGWQSSIRTLTSLLSGPESEA